MIVGIICPKCNGFLVERLERETADEVKLKEVLAKLEDLTYFPPAPIFICRRCEIILEAPDGMRTGITVSSIKDSIGLVAQLDRAQSCED